MTRMEELRAGRLATIRQSDSAHYRAGLLEHFRQHVPAKYRAVDLNEIYDSAWSGRLSPGSVHKLDAFMDSHSGTLLLRGTKGVGKSTLASLIGEYLVSNRTIGGVFVPADALLNEISFESKETSPLRKYGEAPLLVIDDLGSTGTTLTEFQKRTLWGIIDRRWGHEERYTIITTNLPIHATRRSRAEAGSKVESGLSDMLGESAWDRLRDGMTMVEMDGESFRGAL